MSIKKIKTDTYEFTYIDIKYKNDVAAPNIELYRWKKIKAIKYKIQNIFKKYNVTPIKGDLATNVENIVARILFESFSSDKITNLDDGLFNIVQDSKSLYNDLKNTLRISGVQINDDKCARILDEIDISNMVENILSEIKSLKPKKCPDIKITKGAEFIAQIYDSTIIKIPDEVYIKLQARYKEYKKVAAAKNKKMPSCDDAIICLLLRYDSLGSGGNQMGIPIYIKDLFKKCAIDFEGFASSLNHHYKYYCSMFYDIEKYFGSLGPFQNITYVRGTFMLNPPYEKSLLYAMTDKIIGSLSASDKDLCFLFGTPTWANYKDVTFHKTLCDSEFFKKKYVFGDYEVPWYNFITKTYAKIPSSTRYILANYNINMDCLHRTVTAWRSYKPD